MNLDPTPARAPTLPMIACTGCGAREPTWRCRWCATDKLAAICAKAAQDIAGARPPLLDARKAA